MERCAGRAARNELIVSTASSVLDAYCWDGSLLDQHFVFSGIKISFSLFIQRILLLVSPQLFLFPGKLESIPAVSGREEETHTRRKKLLTSNYDPHPPANPNVWQHAYC